MAFNAASRKAIALLVLVFALGIGLGIVGTALVNRRVYGAKLRAETTAQPRSQTHLVSRLANNLNLTPGQQKQIGDILSSMQAGYNAIRQQMNPQFEQVRVQGRDQIRKTLTPEQLPKFEEFLRQVDEERRQRANR